MPEKIYLGDGVYAEFDGYYIWLTTLEGNRIALDGHTFPALVSYAAKKFGVTVQFGTEITAESETK